MRAWFEQRASGMSKRSCTSRPLARRVRRPNVVFSSAAGDLAVGGSEAGPSLAPSEDGGRVKARAPDATMNARLRKGTRTGRRDPPKHLLYPRVNIRRHCTHTVRPCGTRTVRSGRSLDVTLFLSFFSNDPPCLSLSCYMSYRQPSRLQRH